jgi:hypothetical protein
VRYFRAGCIAVFIVFTLAWTLGAIAALLDSQVGDTDKKLAVLITATGCWGVLVNLPLRLWKTKK